jgi:lysophospholipase L1-like esterase
MKHRLLVALALLLALPAPRLAAQSSTVPLKSPVQKVNTAGATQNDIDTDINLPSGKALQVKSGGTATFSGVLAGTPTGGTLNLANLTLTLPSAAAVSGVSGQLMLADATTGAISRPASTVGIGTGDAKLFSGYTAVAVGDSFISDGIIPGALQTQLSAGGTKWLVVNEGISGQTAEVILARIAQSAGRSTASHVIVHCGINDIIGGNASSSTVLTRIQSIVTALSGKVAIVCTLPPFGNNADWTSGRQAQLEAVNSGLAALTAPSGGSLRIVNTYAYLTGGSGVALAAGLDSGDGLHPNSTGKTGIATLVVASGSFTPGTAEPRLALGSDAGDVIARAGLNQIVSPALWLFSDDTDTSLATTTAAGLGAVDVRGGLSVAKNVRIGGGARLGAGLYVGNGTASGNTTSGDLQVAGGGGFGGNIWGGGYLAVGGSITSTTNSTITGGAFVSNATNGVFINTSAGTDARYLRLANTGGDVWLGIESSSAGVGFTGAAAYESVLYSPNNNVYVRTPSFKVAGTLAAGSGPTTLTDSVGKVLSAALNTVGAAQGGTGLATHTTNGLLQATGSTTLQSTLTPAGLTNIGVNSIASAAATDLALSAGSDLTRYTGSLPKFRVAASGSGAFGLYFTTGTTAEGDVRFDNSTYSLHLNAGRYSGWGGEIVMTADAAETLRLTETAATFAVPAKFSSTTGAGYIEIAEQSSSPAAPAANVLRVYAQDNGSGKTRIIIRTSSGTEHVLWTEP